MLLGILVPELLTELGLSPCAEYSIITNTSFKNGINRTKNGIERTKNICFSTLNFSPFMPQLDFALRILLSRPGLSVFQNKYFN